MLFLPDVLPPLRWGECYYTSATASALIVAPTFILVVTFSFERSERERGSPDNPQRFEK